MTATETTELHRQVLIKRGLVQFRLGDYVAALQDMQMYCTQYEGNNFVPFLTQAICNYVLGNSSKTKKTYKEALDRSREIELESHVQKALAKTWSKLNRIRLKKVFGKLRRRTIASASSELDVLRE